MTAAFTREWVTRDGAQVWVESGVGRLHSATRVKGAPDLVEVVLEVTGRKARVTAVADKSVEPFKSLFGRSLGMFAVTFYKVDLEYSFEIRRRDGVEPDFPLVKLPREKKERVLVGLRPAGASTGAGDGVAASSPVRRAG